MGFIEKIKDITTGKTESERKQEAAANKIIRQKVLAAELKEREIQSIRLAQEKIKARAESKLNKIKNPIGMFSAVNEYRTYGSPFGQPRFSRERVVIRKIKGKKGKIKRVKTRIKTSPSYKFRETIQPKYDVLGTSRWI